MSHRALATTLTVALSGMLATACSPPGQEILHHDSHGLLAGSCASGPGGSDATCSCANGYTWTGSYEGTDGLINALRENCGGGDPDYSGGGGQTDPHGYFVGADPNSTGGGGGSSSGTSVDPLATNLKAAFDEWDLLKSLLNLMDDPCAYLRPLAHFENMYYARGGNIGAHLGVNLTGAAGAEVVFDIANHQAAAFAYVQGGVQFAKPSYISASLYDAYAFGPGGAAAASNVIDAWIGVFNSYSGSIGLPVLHLGLEGSYFESGDDKLHGFALGITAAVDTSPISGGGAVGYWVPWLVGTKALAALTTPKWLEWGNSGTIVADGYIQFAETSDFLGAMVRFGAPPLALGSAAALSVMKSHKLTIGDLCPARAKPPVE